MKRESPHKLVILSFTQGTLFWTASGTAMGFIPLLAVTLHLSAQEAGLFVAGAAIGRVAFQPYTGLIITADNAERYYLIGLGCAIVSSVILVCGQHPGWLITARLMEGVGLSLFVVSWRTLLNRMSQLHFFEAVNDSYVVSQNIGRTLGPAIGGIVVAGYGIQAAFLFSALLYTLCFLLAHCHRSRYHSHSPTREPKTQRWRYLCGIFQRQKVLFVIHHIEFFCLGLWLAGWPVYAVIANGITTEQLGYSFSLAALGGLGLFVIKPWTSRLSVRHRLALALALLAIQPLAAMNLSQWSLQFGLLIAVGGLGGALYFTSFHRLLSDTVSVDNIPLTYGVLGSSTFLSQAAGQASAPMLSQAFSAQAPIVLDAALLSACLIMALVVPIARHNIR
ncbi:MFS transporter [Candidatus Symbiopectobacterium sp. NZEC135]|uniref:MFS transporter n=1 Tax=Candidatus Symbiopectobacterium sp. NZEC135 TaxID=2820471 RepID=UPI002227793C|nr:MFS transporter [Candidatus Symbiopectobacterium sp. NZEC135]MCW2479097.1 MFS transporter [Candidatus Symbiopectobacterium sp. NZEC135]